MRPPISANLALSQGVLSQQVKKERSLMAFLLTWPGTQQESTVLHGGEGPSDLEI